MNIKIISLTVMLGLITSILLSSDQYFQDLQATSPNQQYYVKATSPNNKSSDDENMSSVISFQNNFTISLFDNITNKIIWTYKQKANEGSPVEMVPTDEGYVIMRSRYDEYYVFDKKGGLKKVFEIENMISENEWKKFTSTTTTGTLWDQFSQTDFINYGNSRYYYLRTYWGKIILLDYKKSEVLQDFGVSDEVEKKILKETVGIIEKAKKETYLEECEKCKETCIKQSLKQAAFIIKRYNLKEGKQILNYLNSNGDGHSPSVKDYLPKITNKSPN